MGQPVIAYIRVDGGTYERLNSQLQRFSEAADLTIEETYVDEGNTGEAFSTVFRLIAQHEDHSCALLIPSLSALGKNRREVRGRLAALRELGCDIYEAESGMHISWAAHTPVASKGRQLERVA